MRPAAPSSPPAPCQGGFTLLHGVGKVVRRAGWGAEAELASQKFAMRPAQSNFHRGGASKSHPVLRARLPRRIGEVKKRSVGVLVVAFPIRMPLMPRCRLTTSPSDPICPWAKSSGTNLNPPRASESLGSSSPDEAASARRLSASRSGGFYAHRFAAFRFRSVIVAARPLASRTPIMAPAGAGTG